MIFIDSFFLIALIHPGDDYHQDAVALQREFNNVQMITTESVLFEVFASF